MTRLAALAALLAIAGCSTTEPTMMGLNQQQAANLAPLFLNQAPSPAYQPQRCTTFYRPGGMGFGPTATTQCY